MSPAALLPLTPRKRPIQARSEATVAAMLDASIHVRLAVGYRKLTTTLVAERAGVSVGSLYQYFPNRQALLAAVVERHLDELVSLMAADYRKLEGARLEELARGLVDALIAAKWNRHEVTRAMHEPLAAVGGAALVQASALRAADIVANLLTVCPDAEWDDVRPVALFVVMASTSLIQTAIAGAARSLDREALRIHMYATVLGYLKEMRRRDYDQARRANESMGATRT